MPIYISKLIVKNGVESGVQNEPKNGGVQNHKEWSFASNYFIFLKFCLSLKTSYKELI